jgi:ribosome-binding protein aMBF1 (putative translation factor)
MKCCIVCKKTCEETELYDGIFESGMVLICKTCSEDGKIPLIRKPSEDQLEKADKRYSVRERMEHLSGMRDTTEISGEQNIVQRNLARLKMPDKKQQHEDVSDNYYWELNIARRRKKLSIRQLAELIKIDAKILNEIEDGKIPENFEEIFLKLESFLGIKLLKNHKRKISFIRTIDEEKEILSSVRKKMGECLVDGENGEEEDDIVDEIENGIKEAKEIQKAEESKNDKIIKLRRGEIDMSKRENLSNITLNDLVEIKKQREEEEKEIKVQKQNSTMFGDDLELDIDEI